MTKIYCKNTQDIPSIEKIIRLTQNNHLVLEFPETEMIDDAVRNNFIINLKNKLPENYTVFYSGTFVDTKTTTITIKSLAIAQELSENIDAFIKILFEYINVSNHLAKRDKKTLSEWSIQEDDDGQHWSYSHHKTKQFLRTWSSEITSIKAIDPSFLAQFIKTAIGFNKLKNIIKSEYHDTDRLLQFVANDGDLLKQLPLKKIFES